MSIKGIDDETNCDPRGPDGAGSSGDGGSRGLDLPGLQPAALRGGQRGWTELEQHDSTPGHPRLTSASGTLPFTGLDVALLAAGGGGLLGIGLVVRRFSTHPQA